MADPTGAPEPARPPAPEPHEARDVAESFGSDAERYDRTRPRYPGAMVQAIVAASPGTDVLDVGTGTGIAARQFLAAGCNVLGVDVDPRMASAARDRGIPVEVARFEEWEPGARTFDVVVAGQAWHWVEPSAGAAKAAAVLRPLGRIALFWNVFEAPEAMRDPIGEVHRRVLSDVPLLQGESGGMQAYAPRFADAADGLRASGRFGEPEQWRFDWEQTFTTAEWLDQVPSYGGYNRLPPEQLGELLSGLGEVVDAVGGAFTMQYAAVVVTALRGQPGQPGAAGATAG